jgi:transposase-like protein
LNKKESQPGRYPWYEVGVNGMDVLPSTASMWQRGAARTLGVVDQTLFNWVKVQRQGKLKGADSKAKVSAEHLEISRLRAGLARAKMERDILGKATAYFANGST